MHEKIGEKIDQGSAASGASEDLKEEDFCEEVVPWTREQVQALRSKHPPQSPWRVVGLQAAAGAVMVALWSVLGREGAPGGSALLAALAVVLPNALMARGITRAAATAEPGAFAFGFMVWELVKVLLSVAILATAARVMPDMNWLALLSTLLVCLKVSWLALFRRSR